MSVNEVVALRQITFRHLFFCVFSRANCVRLSLFVISFIHARWLEGRACALLFIFAALPPSNNAHFFFLSITIYWNKQVS